MKSERLEGDHQIDEAGPAVQPAIDAPPHADPIAGGRAVTNAALLEIDSENARRDGAIQREIRIILDRNVQQLTIGAVVGAPGKPNEPAPVVPRSVTWLIISQV